MRKWLFIAIPPRPHFQKTSPKLKIATHRFRMKTFTVTCGFCVSLFTTKIAEEKKKKICGARLYLVNCSGGERVNKALRTPWCSNSLPD